MSAFKSNNRIKIIGKKYEVNKLISFNFNLVGLNFNLA